MWFVFIEGNAFDQIVFCVLSSGGISPFWDLQELLPKFEFTLIFERQINFGLEAVGKCAYDVSHDACQLVIQHYNRFQMNISFVLHVFKLIGRRELKVWLSDAVLAKCSQML